VIGPAPKGESQVDAQSLLGTYARVGGGSADQRGLVMSNNTFLRWNQAAEQVGRLTVQPECKEGPLDVMRRVYVRANTCPTAGAGGERPHIAAVGKAVAGL